MNRFIVFPMALTLMSVVLMVFSLVWNLPADAIDKDYCESDKADWKEIAGTTIDLSGTWTALQDRDCRESAKWNSTNTVTIWKENGEYTAKQNGTPMEVIVSGSSIKFVWDLTNGPGKDKNGQTLQIWKGRIEEKRSEPGKIRIYGQWSGAFDYNPGPDSPFNRDFMMIKQ